MEWTECISNAIGYIEGNIRAELTIESIAKQTTISPFYFQKGFTMLCGFTVSEYIRNRRLAIAAEELVSTDKKIIDIALEYGYDSPDSFTKAFTRFHGTTPSSVRKGEATIKSFAPLKIKLTLTGGFTMDYKIIEKKEFTIIGVSKVFKYDEALVEIPKLWAEFTDSEKSNVVCGTYGVNIDESMSGNEFAYWIADNYNPAMDIPEGFATKVIPKFTWAVFPCNGAMPNAIQEVNQKIFSEWLPNSTEYEIAAGYNIEMYKNPGDYPNGLQDEKYYSEIWIPVKRNQ